MKAEVIIVGGGIIGCSIAYFLAKKGAKDVLVIDKGGIASGVTGICPGGVRQQWGTAINCEMSKASVDFFKRINEELEPEHPIHYREVGYLYTFHSEQAVENYRSQMRIQHEYGIPTELLTASEAKAIIPHLNSETIVAASFCSTDGFVDDAYHVTQSFADASKRMGVRFINDEVLEIETVSGSVSGVQCKKNGLISGSVLVNAAGLESKRIAKMAGMDVPIAEETRRILYTNRVEERILEPLLVSFEKGFAAKQLMDGTIYLSYLGSDLKPPYDSFEFQVRAAEVGTQLFPKLAELEFRSHVDGRYDSTPDHQAILGDVPNVSGFFQAIGMSGHGFMMSPAIGQAISELIVGAKTTIDVSGLHFRRFEENRLILEPSVV